MSLLAFDSKYGKLLRHQPLKIRRLQKIMNRQTLMLKYRHDIGIKRLHSSAINITGDTVIGAIVIGDTIRRGVCDAIDEHLVTLLI